MGGYAQYQMGDLNGRNVLLRDGGAYRLYFTNWRDSGKLYWAEGETPRKFHFGGVALETIHAVNDVKKFSATGKDWYVMALHKKGDVGLTVKDADKLWYSLSNDGKHFAEEQRLPGARGDSDQYIFAVGFIARKGRIIRVLYGAGPSALQPQPDLRVLAAKAAVLTARPACCEGNGAEYEADGTLGSDREWIRLPPGSQFNGTISVYAEDGITPLGTQPVNLKPGNVYHLVWKNP
jgi:hypothetical protein